VRSKVRCPTCDGTGNTSQLTSFREDCVTCYGTGWTTVRGRTNSEQWPQAIADKQEALEDELERLRGLLGAIRADLVLVDLRSGPKKVCLFLDKEIWEKLDEFVGMDEYHPQPLTEVLKDYEP